MPLDPLEITGGLAIGEGLGGAIADTVTPRLQNFKNTQWAAHTDVPLRPGEAAEVAAENYDTYGDMATEATFSGYDAARFQHLYDITVTAPGMGELLTMLRRGTINPGNFTHGLRKARLEPMWDSGLTDLANVYIGLGDIATAIVRGAVPAPSWVPVAPPTHTDNVPRFPVTNIDPIALAAKLGYSEDMLRIMTARSGLSLAPILATQAFFRGALTQNDWLLAIAEGDLRTEWAETLKAAARAIPSNLDFTEGHLRGWITQQQMYAGTARHGTSQADTDLMFQVRRRPLSPHQIKQAEARGGVFDASQAPFADPYTASVHEANLGPEWYDLAIHLAGSYPSLFITNRLVTQGTISAATGKDWLTKSGLADEVVTAMDASWTGGGASGADPHVAKAETQLWGTTHTAYKAAEIGKTTAQQNLTTLGIPQAAQTQIFTYWDAERATVRHQLSVAQLQKAEASGLKNPVTGQPFTNADVVAALADRGYSQNDATVLAAE